MKYFYYSYFPTETIQNLCSNLIRIHNLHGIMNRDINRTHLSKRIIQIYQLPSGVSIFIAYYENRIVVDVQLVQL